MRTARDPRIARSGEIADFRRFRLNSQEGGLKARLRPRNQGWRRMRGARAELLSHDGGVTAI